MTTPRYSQAGMQALKHGEAAYRAGDRIVPARQARELLAAVEDLPPKHDCPRLRYCIAHWKWRTVQLGDGRTRVIPPGFWTETFYQREEFRTHAEAVRYATERADADAESAEGAGR